MKGKLIVFEGTDGSGKATQAHMMAQRLKAEGYPSGRLTFLATVTRLPSLPGSIWLVYWGDRPAM